MPIPVSWGKCHLRFALKLCTLFCLFFLAEHASYYLKHILYILEHLANVNRFGIFYDFFDLLRSLKQFGKIRERALDVCIVDNFFGGAFNPTICCGSGVYVSCCSVSICWVVVCFIFSGCVPGLNGIFISFASFIGC